MFYSKFTMFKMGEFNELHAMCNVKLCISNAESACDTTQPVRWCFCPEAADKSFLQQRGCFESVRRKRSAPMLPDSPYYSSNIEEHLIHAAALHQGNENFNASDLLTVSGKLLVHQQGKALSKCSHESGNSLHPHPQAPPWPPRNSASTA